MSDEQVEQAAEVDQAESPDETAADEAKTFDESYVKKLREEAAKYRTQAKENAEAAERLAEIEEAQKTEAQKQAEALEAAQSELEAYRSREQMRAWTDEVSKESGVPASALRGASLEEIQAHAEELKSLITPSKSAPSAVKSISKSPEHSGNVPIGDQIAAAEQAGNKELVAALKAMQLAKS